MADETLHYQLLVKIIRQIPASCRLLLLREVVVQEAEQLGYDLASEVSPNTVSSVFILATDLDSRIARTQHLIDHETHCTGDCPLHKAA